MNTKKENKHIDTVSPPVPMSEQQARHAWDWAEKLHRIFKQELLKKAAFRIYFINYTVG